MSPVNEIIISDENIDERENELPKYVKELRQLLMEENVVVPPDDEMLTRFIRGRKYNLERARKTIKRFLSMKRRYGDLLEGMHPRYFENIYLKNITPVFVNRDSKGRHIIYIRGRKWNPNDINLTNGLLAIYMIVEGMIADVETQRNGITVIIDLKDLTFSQVRQMNFRCLQIIADVAQDTLPVSFQEVHVVNHPLMFHAVWLIIKPLLKEKLRNRIHFHGYNVKSLQKFMNPNILPYNLGGQLTNQEAWDETFIPRLLEKDDYYKEYIQPIEG